MKTHQIFEAHLRGSILPDRNPPVGSNNIKVGLRDDSHAEVVEGAGEEASKCGGKSNTAVSASDSNANLIKRLLIISPN